mmetsp:Transcript_69265/g.200957  ORF Transcript_69265/g.200957 Transcript_69265/m.200957 type:complete len:204 (-) Transcript_69265:718-1329(-)
MHGLREHGYRDPHRSKVRDEKRTDGERAQVVAKGMDVALKDGAILLVRLLPVHVGREVPHLGRPSEHILRHRLVELHQPQRHEHGKPQARPLHRRVAEQASNPTISDQLDLARRGQQPQDHQHRGERHQRREDGEEGLDQQCGLLDNTLARGLDAADGNPHLLALAAEQQEEEEPERYQSNACDRDELDVCSMLTFHGRLYEE